MVRAATIRIQFTDGTSLDLSEHETVQVVTAGPEAEAREGWQKIENANAPATYGALSKARAIGLKQGQKIVTFRGILQIDHSRRM